MLEIIYARLFLYFTTCNIGKVRKLNLIIRHAVYFQLLLIEWLTILEYHCIFALSIEKKILVCIEFYL